MKNIKYLNQYIGKNIKEVSVSAYKYKEKGLESLFKARNIFQFILNQPKIDKYFRGLILGEIWSLDKIIRSEVNNKYFSQFGQDKFINDNFFQNKKRGTFIEIGAYDGLTGSNCAFFEKNLKWSGIIVEPLTNLFNNIRQCRSSILECVAIGSEDSNKDFLFIESGFKQMSGLVDNLSKNHLNKIRKHKNHSEKILAVPVITLNNLLKKYNYMKIDYCSIDVEGMEEKILSNFKFNEFDINIFSIENNSGKENRLSKIMFRNNYSLISIIGKDEIWKKNY